MGWSGVGAVATQAFSDRRYGALGIELLAAGRSPEEALEELTGADAEAQVRQVGILAADGRAAAHTGRDCVPAAGHVTGDGFTAQANMMRSEQVWPAMAQAFEATRGALHWRLLAALDAAEAAGGDFRGRQSAAILVVRGEPTERPWDDKLLELRVDEHAEPLAELRRLVELADGYRAAMRLRESAPSPDELAALRRLPELDRQWGTIFEALRAGDVAGARKLVRPLFESEPRWRGYVAQPRRARDPAAGRRAAPRGVASRPCRTGSTSPTRTRRASCSRTTRSRCSSALSSTSR